MLTYVTYTKLRLPFIQFMESTNKRKANVYDNTLTPGKENTQNSSNLHDDHSKPSKRRPLSDLQIVNDAKTSLSTHSIVDIAKRPRGRHTLIDITNSKSSFLFHFVFISSIHNFKKQFKNVYQMVFCISF